MKKKILSLLFLPLICSCGGKYGEGGDNACQFVREQVSEQADNIKSVECIACDTLLGDEMLAFGQVEFARAGSDFWHGNISREQYRAIIDSTANVLNDVQSSWNYPAVVNDSLHSLQKYEGCWRRVFTVRVTMKSGTTKDPRILMDKDGTTPRMLGKAFGELLDEYQRNILKASEDCILEK